MGDSIIYSVCCIDYRYDALTTNYFNAIGLEQRYFLATTAGGALALGYKNYCNNNCNNCSCTCNKSCNKTCNPENPDMILLKKGLCKNLEISIQLQPTLTEVYLLNHQNCGAFVAFLSCSGYPNELGVNNELEININADVLVYAKEYIKNKFPNITRIRLGLIDTNGTVADYHVKSKKWVIVYQGPGKDPRGLWFNYFNY